ncbi:MAG: FAD-dependent monooxygenase [Burkholderiales bacterium]
MTAGAEPRGVLVLGAGPVGCVLATALRGGPHAVRLVDPLTGPPAAFRPIALSQASRLILERIGAWGRFSATPIVDIHVSQAGAFGRTRLAAAECGVPALGYVTHYAALVAALRALVKVEASPAGEARLTVHAEGAPADLPSRGYGHEALVARVAADPAPGGTAYERFTPDGPLALLPLGDEWAVIWGLPPARAEALASAAPAAFLAALQRAFGERAGTFVEVRARARVPLALRLRLARVHGREVYVGNAAQTLHPVAGQGLNLGLRDAWDLAQTLHGCEDAGDAAALARFASARRLDAAATVGVTELLARGFVGGAAPVRVLRGALLTCLDTVPAARRFFARRMIFGPSALP